MVGYCGFSMSNNAVAAYNDGLVPASKIRGVPAVLVREHCRPSEWHHCSKNYNEVDFYEPSKVRAIFGLEAHEDYKADPRAVAALAAHKAGAKKAAEVMTNCRVEWIEWSGSLRRPKAKQMAADCCTVTVKGQTARITLPDGRTMTKRLATNGFFFKQIAPAGVDARTARRWVAPEGTTSHKPPPRMLWHAMRRFEEARPGLVLENEPPAPGP